MILLMLFWTLTLFGFALFQASPPSPFDLPLLAVLSAVLIGPTKIIVDVVKGAIVSIPVGALPLVGVIAAFGLALVFHKAAKLPLDSSALALCFLAALSGQAGAMLATATQNKANAKRLDAELEARDNAPIKE